MAQVIIKGRDLKGKVVVSYTTEDAPKKDKNGKEFRILIFNKRAFRVSEKVFQQWEAGKLAAITLEESEFERTVIDDAGVETKEMASSYTYAGSESKDSEIEELTHEAKVANIGREIAIANANLSPEKMKALQEAEL